MDYGLGIGYNPESTNTPSQSGASRSATVNSLRTGMMVQFKSNFVAAASNSQSECRSSSSTFTSTRPVLPGFVSGGSIGGENRTQPTTSLYSASKPGDNSNVNGSEKKSER